MLFCFTLATVDNFDYATPTAESLFERLVLRSRHYEMKTPQKGVRSYMFYTIKAGLFSGTTADDNGRLYYNVRNGKNYFVVYVNKENCLTLECYYR